MKSNIVVLHAYQTAAGPLWLGFHLLAGSYCCRYCWGCCSAALHASHLVLGFCYCCCSCYDVHRILSKYIDGWDLQQFWLPRPFQMNSPLGVAPAAAMKRCLPGIWDVNEWLNSNNNNNIVIIRLDNNNNNNIVASVQLKAGIWRVFPFPSLCHRWEERRKKTTAMIYGIFE